MESYPNEFFEEMEAINEATRAGDYDKVSEICRETDRRRGIKQATPEEIRKWVETTGGLR